MNSMYRLWHILAFLVVAVSLSACMGSRGNGYTKAWVYADLRTLDPADAVHPALDILAVYWRGLTQDAQLNNLGYWFPYLQEGQRYQLRIDFLASPIMAEADIYIALDHRIGGTRELPLDTKADVDWDTLISLPASGDLQAVDSQGNPKLDLELQVLRDPVMDTLTLNLNSEVLSQAAGGVKGQVFTTLAGSGDIQDRSSPFLTASPQPGQAQVLLAFWNTFPAYTPSQTLRRWDGAHTGPLGGRHGLNNLLRTARNQGIPLVALDLMAPSSLSALDYADELDIVRDMLSGGTLMLPDRLPPISLPGNLQAKLVADNRRISTEFGLTTSNAIYAPISDGLPSGQDIIFTPDFGNQAPAIGELDTIRPIRWKGNTVFPIPVDLPTDQATLDGPSIALRQALIGNALTNTVKSSPTEILVLGGDLPQSTWGEPQRARATFEYLREHPWINFLDGSALSTFQAEPGVGLSLPRFHTTPREDEIIKALYEAPQGQLNQAALQAFLSLHAPFPTPSPELATLRDIYLGGVSMLLAAAEWESEPVRGVDCSRDLDMDGDAECILASQDLLMIFEPGDGSLVYVFARTDTGVHQLIGPSSQFVIGLSDPSTWDFSAGLKADPAVIPGAFADDKGPYQIHQDDDQLVFQNELGSKKYHLTPKGFVFEYQTGTPSTWEIPIALDPWMRFGPNWSEGYLVNTSKDALLISADDDFQLEIDSSSELLSHTFKATKDRMGRQENPNYEYPPGHYLPFPLMLLEVEPSQDGFIEFNIND